MRVKIEVDCTADEARHFLGLPEVSLMQQRLLEETEERMRTSIQDSDPKALLDKWLPMSVQQFEQLFRIWAPMAKSVTGSECLDQKKS